MTENDFLIKLLELLAFNSHLLLFILDSASTIVLPLLTEQLPQLRTRTVVENVLTLVSRQLTGSFSKVDQTTSSVHYL